MRPRCAVNALREEVSTSGGPQSFPWGCTFGIVPAMTEPLREDLTLSRHLSYFHQHGRLYAYHDLFGFLMGMSPDIVGLLEFHRDVARGPAEVDAHFGRHFTRSVLGEFMSILEDHACLVDPDIDEPARLWRSYPVRARWVVYDKTAGMTFWRAWRGADPVAETVPGWAAATWEACDGNTSGRDLYDKLDAPPTEEEFLRVIGGWVHHDRQYLRMSRIPVTRYGAEWKWPSYLRSTMPYEPWTPGQELAPDPLEALGVPVLPPHGYYEHGVADAGEQFDEVETTLSHLLREPHVLLGGATFAARVGECLSARDLLSNNTRNIVEVGAGQGHLAAGLLCWMRDAHTAGWDALRYTIVDLAPTLRDRQRATLEAAGVLDKVDWIAGNVEDPDTPIPEADFLICNEVVGDFTTVKLNRSLVGVGTAAGEEPPDEETKTPPTELSEKIVAMAEANDVRFLDAPEEFYVNLGAWEFVARLAEVIRPGGGAWITEYGEYARYPRASTHLDHIEFSIHFGHLQKVAIGAGFNTELAYVQELIGFDRQARALASTRSWYGALRAMLATHDVHLGKAAYTDEMFRDAIEEKVSLADIGDVRFESADERCMGLLPHEFKALILSRRGG